MANLKVEYLGVEFQTPIVMTACNWTSKLDGILEVAEAGAGAVATKTISKYPLPPQGFVSMVEGGTLFVASDPRVDLDEGCEMIAEAKKRTKAAILANVLGRSNQLDTWREVAIKCEKAGADIIEVDLNGHLMPGEPVTGSPEAARFHPPSVGQDPRYTQEVVAAIKDCVSVPVIAKLTPSGDYIAITKAALAARADGISMINSMGGLRGLDIENGGKPLYPGQERQGRSAVAGSAITAFAAWNLGVIKTLFPDVPVIGGGGVMNSHHAIERLMLGAHAAGVCATVYVNGVNVITEIVKDISRYMDRHGYASVADFRGQALPYFGASPFWAA